MVYTGKPSRACATCKKRRIKCDEGRPACGQCIKSRRDCHGYKTEAELMFRDETKVTAQRAAKKASPSPKPSSPEEIDFSSLMFSLDDEGTLPPDSWPPPMMLLDGSINVGALQLANRADPTWFSQRTPSPDPALSIGLQAQANAYFFNHFTLFGTDHSFHLYDILAKACRQAELNDPIKATTDAVSMVILSKKRGNEQIRPEAARTYANAVKQVAAALADPVRVRENATLLSIIMLGFAETMDVSTASHPGFVPRFTQRPGEKGIAKFHHAWGAHADGAQLVVSSRGLQDLAKTDEGLHLAAFVRLQTIHKQMFIAQPINHLDEIWQPFMQYAEKIPKYSGQVELSNMALQIPTLRFRGLILCRKPMQMGLKDDIERLIHEILAVDRQLAAWQRRVRDRYGYSIAGYYISPQLGDVANEDVWPGAVFNYNKLADMNSTNLSRTYRIFLQMLIFNLLERLIPPDELQRHSAFVECRRVTQTSINEIAASVPYGFGIVHEIPLSPNPMESPLGTFAAPELKSQFVETLHEAERASNTTSPGSTPGLVDGGGPAIGAWYLTWTLFVAYGAVSTDVKQKDWLRGRLKHIGERFGIAQALVYHTYQRDVYTPGEPRRFKPTDFTPPPWEPFPETYMS